jgi:hypothetical protein
VPNTKDNNTKNLTVNLTMKEHEDLDFLVNYFQEQSIATVKKADVFKFMIKYTKRIAEQDQFKKVDKIIKEAEESNTSETNNNINE